MNLKIRLKNYLTSKLRPKLLSLVSLTELKAPLKGTAHFYPSLSESIATAEAPDMHFFPDAAPVQESTYSTPDIYTLPLNNVYFCPRYNLLHTRSRQIIKESISTRTDLAQLSLSAFYRNSIHNFDEPCSLFRSHHNPYYHTLIDNLPRLYLLHHPRFREIDDIKLLCADQLTNIEEYFLHKLLPDNVSPVVLDKNKLYRLENLIFPSFLSRRFSGYLPTEYRRWFVERVAPKRSRQKNKRIFISRIATKKGPQRCILNEDELFQGLRPYGFERYVLEELSTEEQIALFYDAEAVVAAHGAGLTNTIFSSEIKVIELFPAPFVLPHFYFLAKSLGHSYQYWCADRKDRHDNFSVDVSAVLNLVEMAEKS